MEQFGCDLRTERERRRITLDTICEVTKVSVRHLEALESGRYAELPGGVFRKGILRSYLSAVGLEESGWVERFDAALRETVPANEQEGWSEFAENVRRNRSGRPASQIDSRWLGVAVMIAALFVLGWGVWKLVLHGRIFL
jgi:cytoskeletal protein RodZ